jgi:hypothetical protein
MVESTVLVVAAKKMSVPRLLKRTLQVAMAVAVTASVLLVVIVGNGAVVGRGTSFQVGINTWLAFIKFSPQWCLPHSLQCSLSIGSAIKNEGVAGQVGL